jgi:hypothetical protein
MVRIAGGWRSGSSSRGAWCPSTPGAGRARTGGQAGREVRRGGHDQGPEPSAGAAQAERPAGDLRPSASRLGCVDPHGDPRHACTGRPARAPQGAGRPARGGPLAGAPVWGQGPCRASWRRSARQTAGPTRLGTARNGARLGRWPRGGAVGSGGCSRCSRGYGRPLPTAVGASACGRRVPGAGTTTRAWRASRSCSPPRAAHV